MSLGVVLDYLKKIGAAQEMHDWPDAVLLERFVHRREEAAFAMLLHRHGPLVMGVCRRVLGDVHDAEDAFQATFVVLARRAGSLRRPAQLGPWLYGVAQRVAWKARAKAAARHSRQRELTDMPHAEPLDELTWHELRPVLDEEIGRLPEKYRAAVVLCYLQGKTHEQAAQELGWPRTSLTNRLARARDLLRSQLTGRGIALSAGTLATALAEKTAPAAVGAVLTIYTAKAAAGVAAGEAVATSILSAQAVALAEEVMSGMMGMKFKVVVLALALGVTVGGVGVGAGVALLPSGSPSPQAAVGQSIPAPAAQPPAPRVDAEGVPLPPGVVARLGSTRMRHEWVVDAVVVAPDGRTMASAGRDDGIRFWDMATGKQIRYIPLPKRVQLRTGLTFTADGRELLCRFTIEGPQPAGGRGRGPVGGRGPAPDDGHSVLLRLDPATGQELRRAEGGKTTIYISPSGQRFAYHDEGAIHICDTASGREMKRITDIQTGTSLAFSPGDRILAVSDADGAISLFDTATGAKTGSLKRENATYTNFEFASDGRTLLGFTRSGAVGNSNILLAEVHLWDLETQQFRCQLQQTDRDRLITWFCFSPDGRTLVTGHAGGVSYRNAQFRQRPDLQSRADLVLWDAATGQELRRYGTGAIGTNRVAFSPDGKTLVAASFEGTVVFRDVASGQLLPISANPAVTIQKLWYADSGRLVAQADRFLAWDPATGREVGQHADTPTARSINALSPDGRLLAGVDAAGTVRTWDSATGQEVRPMEVPKLGAQQRPPSVYDSLKFTPDGSRLIAIAGEIVIWDVATGRLLGTLTGPRVSEFEVAPDGRRLASVALQRDRAGVQSDIQVWDLMTFKEVRRWNWRAETDEMAFAPDGRWLATLTGGRGDNVHLWDIEAGRELRSWRAESIGPIAISPDGRTLATGSVDGGVRLWEAATGGERHRFTGHVKGGGAIAFAPDGRTLAAARFQAPVFILNVLGRLEQPDRPPTAAELEQAWAALAGADAKDAFGAIRRLVAAPDVAVVSLRERLKPAAAADTGDTPETLRAIRAVEALEYIATPAAREHLKALAGGAAGATLTDAAAQAFKRLGS